jgi:hypothetical protein
MVEQANGFPARQSQKLHSQGSEFDLQSGDIDLFLLCAGKTGEV